MGVLSRLVEKAISVLFFLAMIWICGIVLFGGGLEIPDWVRKNFILPNLVLLPIALAVFCLIAELVKRRKLHIVVIACMIFVIQFLVAYTYFFTTGWDAGTVMDKAFEAAFNGVITSPEQYYSYYVNNIMIHCLEYLAARLTILIGFESETVVVTGMVFVLCALCSITGILVYDITQMLLPNNKVASNMSLIMYVLLIVISPWIPIIYTDSLGLILPTLLIWLYLRARLRLRRISEKLVFTALISFIAIMAYRVKATAFITFIAIIVTEVYFCIVDLSKGNTKELKGYLIKAAAAIVVVVLSTRMFTVLYSACGIVLDPERRCPMSHYLMMGFNNDEVGTFNFPDSDESVMIDGYDARSEYCMSVAKKRIKKLLPLEIFNFEARKTLVNYHDGTFGYGIEGGFYGGLLDDRVPVLSKFFKDIFWDTGRYYPVLATLFQGIWIAVLFLGTIFTLCSFKGKYLLLKIILIGIFLFLSLFEARARYVFVYAPIYIVTAAIGFEKVRSLLRREEQHG